MTDGTWFSADRERYEAALATARAALLEASGDHGWWEGRISPSASSTAAAVLALGAIDPAAHRPLIDRGLAWLAANANADGGWGRSPADASDLGASALAWAALALADGGDASTACAARHVEEWLTRRVGRLAPDSLASALSKSYGRERAMSAAVLCACLLSGRLGRPADPDAWRWVPQLPLELNLVSHRLLPWVRPSVASWSIPLVIASGLLRHRRRPDQNPLLASLRAGVARPLLRELCDMQPEDGGLLASVTLTALVGICLAGGGWGGRDATRKASAFLVRAACKDGSWPSLTDMTMRVTVRAVDGLRMSGGVPAERKTFIRNWLTGRQTRTRTPVFQARPGGWSWSGLPNGLSDAEDTALAILALKSLGPVDYDSRQAAGAGVLYLCALQNADGGLPMFCRSRGGKASDRSGPEVTAQALQALDAWYDEMPRRLKGRIDTVMERGMEYLDDAQRDEGHWVPIGLGSESYADQPNPVYGTAVVVSALSEITPERLPSADFLVQIGADWLAAAQHSDGGWGRACGEAPSIQETAVATRALAGVDGEFQTAAMHGVEWLLLHTNGGRQYSAPAPVGLGSAGLVCSESLHPLLFTVAALGRFLAEGRAESRP